MDRTDRRTIDDLRAASCIPDLLPDIIRYLLVCKSVEVIVDYDPLPQRLVDLFLQDVVQVRLPSENQGKTVYRIILLVHQHFQIPQDTAVQVLGFIQDTDERLPFLFVQVIQAFLD